MEGAAMTQLSFSACTPLGDRVKGLSLRVGAQMSATEFLTTLREGRAPGERYIGYITSTYPLVVAFNEGLLRSFAKLDAVQDAGLAKGMARQLIEELDHNDLWRGMLESFDIDHAAAIAQFRADYTGTSEEALRSARDSLLAGLHQGGSSVTTGLLGSPVFPEAVLLLTYQIRRTASDPGLTFWDHFACQLAVEVAVVEAVTKSVLPGVVGREDLSHHPIGLAWWRAHSRPVDCDAESAAAADDEERHQQDAIELLNRVGVALGDGSATTRAVEDTLDLLHATVRCHDADVVSFNATRFTKLRPSGTSGR